MARWHYPLDPDCPIVAEYLSNLIDDPMTDAMGAPVDEIIEAFERNHRRKCKRCQEFGAANVGVE